jgi:predicted nucleotidyltransferase
MSGAMPGVGLEAIIPQLKGFFARQPEVVLAYLYGSYATGRVWARSDLDIGVLFDDKIDHRQQWRLPLHYGTLLSSQLKLGVEIDVRELNGVPVDFAFQVIQPHRCIYARTPADRLAFEASVLIAYLDFKPVRDMYRRYMITQLRKGNTLYGLEFERHLRSTGQNC